MKFTKMSLVAALLIGSSAFAIENTKVSGDAKVYYSTNDAGTNSDLFKKDTSAAQAAFGLGITTDLVTGVSAGMHMTALSTLGLEGQLVNNVWEATNGVSDSWWVDEAWLAATLGKTTVKVGRMELDTPLVFSEQWSIAANTFEAAVIINQDVPDTTLVGAYVGGSNGTHNTGAGAVAGGGIAGVIAGFNANGTTNFSQFHRGAYAAAAINNSWKPLTVQAWYFQASHVLKGAAWLQADLAMEGITAGVQYTTMDLSSLNPALQDNTAIAGKLGYTMKDMFTASVAYSQVDDAAGAGAGFNLSGGGAAQSKLYTEAWWNYSYVTKPDTQAINVTVESPVNGMFDLGVYYTDVNQGAKGGNRDLTELTLTASKSVGPLDATLAYINTDATDQNAGSSFNTVQAYLTLNF